MILFLLFALVGAISAACPVNYQQINNGDCFRLYTDQTNFNGAESKCVQDGGHLASIHSANEQTALVAIMGTAVPLIGMQCTDDVAGHCSWSDGKTVDYSNFPGGNPITAFGRCVHVDKFSATNENWISWNCDAPNVGFLCRIPFTPAAGTCTNGYTAYNGGCAAVKNVEKSQADAEANCVQDGGHLASIHSDADNTFYQNLGTQAGLSNNFYIGLAWNSGANAYKWADATSYDPATFNKFIQPFPNTVFGYCVQMMISTEFGTLGQWTNIDCITKLPYACWRENGDGANQPKAPAQCQSIDFFYDQGDVYSPNFPISIPAGQSCEYVLVTAVGTKVGVSFPSFSTDAGSSLALYYGLDDKTPFVTLSGTLSNPSYQSTTNVIKMIFTASAAPTGQGWQAKFNTIGGGPVDPVTDAPFNPSVQCPPDQYTVDSRGLFVYSPNWPGVYPAMADCLYYIHSANNKKLSIAFGYMDTEQCCDFVVVYDGPNNKSPIIATVSGQSSPIVQTYYSTGTTLTLEFFSDSQNEGNGWVATLYEV